ncbi:MAG: hypothetical protein AAGA12_12840 [Pseudomonadota bacterium]
MAKVTSNEEFEAWLETQDQPVCVAIATRTALRVFPAACPPQSDQTSNVQNDLAVLTGRALLTSGVAGKMPTSDVIDSALSALSATRSAVSAFSATHSATRSAVSALSAALSADSANRSALSATRSALSAAVSALSANRSATRSALSAAFSAAFKDQHVLNDLGSDQWEDLYAQPLWDSAILRDLFDPIWTAFKISPTGQSDEFAFWVEWYQSFVDSSPMDWELQRRVALIDDEIWKAGAKAVAKEIQRIQAEYLIEKTPQVEEVFETDNGLYEVRGATANPSKLVDSVLSRVDFTLSTAAQSNHCDLSEISTPAKTLRYALLVGPDDPNTMEQFFRSASAQIKGKIADGIFAEDDEIKLLTDTLDEVALQLRADHPDVADATLSRLEQGIRELNAEKRLEAAARMDNLLEGTGERLRSELSLAAEITRDGSSEEATAEALRQSGNRAGKITLAERAKKAEGSGAMAGVKIGMRAQKLVEFVISVLSGGG